MTGTTIRVGICDDDGIVRNALTSYLRTAEGLELIHTSANGAEALAALAAEPVDVLVMDMRMPVMDGLTTTRAVRERFPATRVLMLTSFDDDDTVREALAAGASGFLLKDTSPQGLVDAVRAVQQGTSVVSPGPIARLLQSQAPARPPVTDAPPVDLRPREQEILGLLCAAYSNAEICEALSLSESTVKTHVSTIMSKLGVSSRLKAVVRAHELGLV